MGFLSPSLSPGQRLPSSCGPWNPRPVPNQMRRYTPLLPNACHFSRGQESYACRTELKEGEQGDANFLNSLGRVSCPRPHASLLLHLTCLSNTQVIRKTQDLIFCVKNQSSVLRTMSDKLFWRSKREPRHISRETEYGKACIRRVVGGN